jgi:hypothetical protein
MEVLATKQLAFAALWSTVSFFDDCSEPYDNAQMKHLHASVKLN